MGLRVEEGVLVWGPRTVAVEGGGGGEETIVGAEAEGVVAAEETIAVGVAAGVAAEATAAIATARGLPGRKIAKISRKKTPGKNVNSNTSRILKGRGRKKGRTG